MSSELAVDERLSYRAKMVSAPPPKTGKAKSFQVRLTAEDDDKLLLIARHGPYSQNEAVRVAIDMAYRSIVEAEKKKPPPK